MTAYNNFVRDYPTRCNQLLNKFFKDAGENNLEVTLLLSMAASGFVIPYARLSESAHPTKDAESFKVAKDKLDAELKKPFLASELWGKDRPDSWRFGQLENIDGDPDSWGLKQFEALSISEQARDITRILRNALAHGNIYTRGNPHIEKLVFLSRVEHSQPELGYNCLIVSPLDLKQFMKNWFDVLGRVEMPARTFVESDLLEEIIA